jgi:hypothetical protein
MTVAFGIAGAAIGSAYGNPALGWAIGTTLAGFLYPPRLDPQERGRLDDLRVTGSGYGVMIPKQFGDGRLGGNIVWASEKVDNPRTTSSGGKGTPRQTTVTHSYSFNVAVQFADGPIANVRRIWAEDLLIYEDGLTDYDITIYLGTEDQDVDPTIESFEGVGSTPAYRGTAYFVVANMNLDPWNGRTPSFNVELAADEPTPTIIIDCNDTGVAFIKPDGTLWAAGKNWYGRFGTGAGSVNTFNTTPQLIAEDVVAAGCSQEAIFYADALGNIYHAGLRDNYLDGTGVLTIGGTYRDTFALVKTFDSPVADIRVGFYTVFAVLENGEIWGSGLTGTAYNRGDGSNAIMTGFTKVSPSLSGSLTNASRILTEYDSGFAIGADGYLYYTGRQDQGQFGIGSTTEVQGWTKHTSAGPVLDARATVATTTDAAVIVKADGTVWAAGKNFFNGFGEASLGTAYTNSSFRQVPGLADVTKIDRCITTGTWFALDESGNVWSWGTDGSGSSGQGVADGTKVDPAIIVTGCTDVAATRLGGIAVKEDNTVWGWGDGNEYQLGNNSTSDLTTPALMPWSLPEIFSITVADVLEALADDVGLPSGSRDFSDATAEVTGYLVGQRMSFAQAVESLLRAYAVDLAEYDGKVRAITRGGAIVATIDEDDLGAFVYGSGSPTSRVTKKDTDELELPGRLDLTYFSKARAYQQSNQPAIRFAKGEILDPVTVNTPITFTDDIARQTAEMLLYSQWLERDQYTFTLPYDYLYLAPGDPVYLPVNGEDVRVRIVQMQIAIFGVISLSAVRDDPSILTQTALGGNVDRDDWVLTETEETTLVAWNGNALKDSHADEVGLYLAGTGPTGWPGAVVYISRDSGGSYQTLESLTDAASVGESASSIGSFDGTAIWDTTSELDVAMIRGVLESASTAEVIAGANVALLGSEVIQFEEVEPLGNGVYRLTRLLRGRRGTVMDAHPAGEAFLVLDPGTVKRAVLEPSLRGRTVLLRAPSVGQALVDVADVSVDIEGYEFYPYSPVDVRGARDGSDNLTITWKRRARKDFVMQDGTDIPLGEDSEAYEVDVMNGLSVVRTITGLASETASYSAANQTTDFGSPQASLTVRVYQIGRYGRGYKSEATI